MSYLNALGISASGMTAQRLRLDVAADNIANIQTTRTEDGTPYVRKTVVFEAKQPTFDEILGEKMGESLIGGVKVSEIIEDETDLRPIYDPEHPDANEDGYVMMPNIDLVKETTDAMAATRSYEANITAFNALKLMAQKAMDIGK